MILTIILLGHKIKEKRPCQAKELVSAEKITLIRETQQKISATKAKPLKEQLSENITYKEIRCVLAEIGKKMKIVKKYEYKLTEETLDKDIDKFIKEARKGAFEWDYKYGMEGLRIIKQYFKIIQEEFDNGNFSLCKDCYTKLLYLLFEEGYKNSYFGYEDIVGRSNLDFEKIIKQYFICLIKLYTVDELFYEFIEYLKKKQDYYFEAAEKTITTELSDKDFTRFMELLLLEAEKIGKEDYELHDILNFLLDIAKKKDEGEFLELAQRFAPILGYENVNDFLEDYEK